MSVPVPRSNAARSISTFCERAEAAERHLLELLQVLEVRTAQRDDLVEALDGLISIGKRDLTNPKYDGYFDFARELLAKARGGK